MKIEALTVTFLLALLISACSQSDSLNTLPDQNPTAEWSIPSDEVFDGGPGKDGIPSVDTPLFESASEIHYMEPNDLILAIKIGEEIRAYTHPVLDWHEIINDEINGVPFALTYCPLTGTGFGWSRILKDELTSYGVSGLLYNSNLMPYDRASNSTWSQLSLECVNGELVTQKTKNINFLETKWSTWIELFPQSKVVTTETGHSRSYGTYPYGDYRTNHDRMLFPVNHKDERLPSKERVLAVHSDKQVIAYRFKDFDVINFSLIETEDYVIIGSQSKTLMSVFSKTLPGGQHVSLSIDQNSPVIMTDQSGNKYDIFGEIVEGPNQGDRLQQPFSYISYWFALAAFNPAVEIYNY